jgi:hypothetical protein
VVTFQQIAHEVLMPAKTATSSSAAQPISNQEPHANFSDWIASAINQGVKPEQALAFIGLGLMQRMGNQTDSNFTTVWNESQGEAADLQNLRQRLELTDLAVRTGAPLSTAEVAVLLGARPGTPMVERGGLIARRISRNVWKLSRSGDNSERAGAGYDDAFRRRL